MQPAFQPSGPVRGEDPGADRPDDRRPADGGRRRLGVVRGRLVERERRRRASRATRTARSRSRPPTGCSDPIRRPGRRATGPSARTTCSSTTTSRSTTSPPSRRRRRPGSRTARLTSRTRPSSSSSRHASDEGLHLEARQLRQADRRGERASRLRERAERQRPPRRAAQVDRGQQVREGHDGRRDLRRVRRPVGSRVAARPGQRQRPARRLGPGHAHPRADHLRRT